MPVSAPKQCTYKGCRVLVKGGGSRCDKHPHESWAKAQPTKRRTGRWLQEQRAELFDRDPFCAECRRQGRVRAAAFRDHIIPLSQGGVDDDSNTQGLCAACHDIKSAAESTFGTRKARAKEGELLMHHNVALKGGA